ncbi:MAG: AI-2E family transporter [Candidatus Andersenbacteria bacterium]
MKYTKLQIRFFLSLLFGISVLAFFVFRPYLGAVVLAATFAVIFYPLYRRILGLVGGRENVAATLTTVCVLLVVFVPFILFGIQIFREAQLLYGHVTGAPFDFSIAIPSQIEDQVQALTPRFSLDVDQYVRQGVEWLLQHIGSIFSSVAKLVLNIFLSLFTLYYLLRDGRKLKQKIMSLSPLQDQHDQQIFSRLEVAVNSVIRGSLMIALLQGIVTGIGLALFGVPNAALWGSVTVLAALIPTVGTSVVLAPAIAYLFFTGHAVASAGLLGWGVVAVGLIDNLLGPRLINRGIKLHPLLILLAVLGGLGFFGPIGYILGPLVISLLFALLDIYPLVMRKST